MSKLNILLEADEVVYFYCFAAQKTCNKIVTDTGKEYDFGDRKTKPQIETLLKQADKLRGRDYEIEEYYKAVHSIDYCLKLINNKLNYLSKLGNVKLFLTSSDKSNFRYERAITAGPLGIGYKAGRKKRPLYYQAARDFVVEQWNAMPVVGYEADDALGLYNDGTCIMAHIDKDIDMLPGTHMDWKTCKTFESPRGLGTLTRTGDKIKGTGLKSFFWQMLTGDRTDNIPGLPKANVMPKTGKIGAYDELKDLQTIKECRERVEQLYMIKYNDEDLAYRRILENADLLWMCQKHGEYGSEVWPIIEDYYNE